MICRPSSGEARHGAGLVSQVWRVDRAHSGREPTPYIARFTVKSREQSRSTLVTILQAASDFGCASATNRY